MQPPAKIAHENMLTLAFTAMLVPIWLLMHGYPGLTGDAQIYAFQASARIHPQLGVDLYLQNTSQDQFTVFSPFYAFFIAHWGLEGAARLLTMVFTVWLYVAAWRLARTFTDRSMACLVVAFLMIISGDYGGSGVFVLFENYLTARLPAEAMIITALACYFSGARLSALLFAVAALFVHPLIALPGCLLLICLTLPFRVAAGLAALGVFAALAIAIAAANFAAVGHVISIMDPQWLGIVRERSQFLFLPLWSFRDWSINVQPFMSLLLSGWVIRDCVARKLCASVILMGTAGLALALIGALVGPIALLVQGQPWRWVWLVTLLGALLTPLTIIEMWRKDACGPICAVLLVISWSISAIDGTACASLALLVWWMRRHINERAGRHVQWLACLFAAAALAWASVGVWKILASAGTMTIFTALRSIFDLRITMIILAGLIWWILTAARTRLLPAFGAVVLLLAGMVLLPPAFHQRRFLESAADIGEFADWARVIPPTSTVLVAPSRDVGAFVWFTLQRPNYLSLDQSAGVVFSRPTAIEIERRSQVLLPLMDQSWKILTRNRAIRSGASRAEPNRPLTAEILMRVCEDPKLGFVISPQKIGMDAIPHERAGAWKDWNLYDCRNARGQSSPI